MFRLAAIIETDSNQVVSGIAELEKIVPSRNPTLLPQELQVQRFVLTLYVPRRLSHAGQRQRESANRFASASSQAATVPNVSGRAIVEARVLPARSLSC